MATLALYLTKTRRNFAPKLKETKHFELAAIVPRSLAVNQSAISEDSNHALDGATWLAL